MDFFTTEDTEKRDHFHHTTVIAKISLSFLCSKIFATLCAGGTAKTFIWNPNGFRWNLPVRVPPDRFTQDFHPKIPKFSAQIKLPL